MVDKKSNKNYIPNKGFGLALVFTVFTFVALYYGLVKGNIIFHFVAILLGIVGLYLVKKSWKSYTPSKKNNFVRKKN